MFLLCFASISYSSLIYFDCIQYEQWNNEDENHDGILSWEDFRLLAEKFAKIQRRGRQPEKEVVERWQSIFEKWWNELTSYADSNKVFFAHHYHCHYHLVASIYFHCMIVTGQICRISRMVGFFQTTRQEY